MKIATDIKLIAAGSSNYGSDWTAWNRTVLKYLKDHVDYISLHNYTGNRKNDYYEFVASTRFAEKAVKITEGIIREELLRSKRKIYIAFDEYNACHSIECE